MKDFSYSFAVSMLHSIWQMAVLLLLYFLLTGIIRRPHPVFKRNLLFCLLLAQLGISIITFISYYCNFFGSYENTLNEILAGPLLNQSWMQLYAGYIFYAYSLVVLYKSAFLIKQHISYRNNYNTDLQKPPVDVKLFTTLKSYQFGIKRKVSIWYSTKTFTPLTFGFWKPVILMPVAFMNSLSTEEVEALIIHELTHIRNNDYLLNWLLLVTETIYFFNPFFRIAAGKIKLEREKCCDTQVLQFDYPAVVYAEALLKIASQQKQNNKLQLAAVISKPQLLRRIQFFSNEKAQQFSKKNYSFFPVLFITGIFILNIFVLSLLKNKITPSPVAVMNIKQATPEIKDAVNTMPLAEETREKTVQKTVAKVKATAVITEKNSKENAATDPVIPASNDNYVMPVVLTTTAPVTSKVVEINEESSSGKIITQVYKIELKNGKWVTQPLYMTTEIKASKDSLKQKIDSLTHIDTVQ